MKKMLRFSRLFLGAMALCGLLGSVLTAQAAEYDKVKIRMGNIYNKGTTQGLALEFIKKAIEKESDGRVRGDIFHGGSLGSEKDHIQAQKEGSLELLFSGTAGIGLYVPATAVFEAWYAFKSIDQMNDAVESLEDELDKAFQAQGFKMLGAFYDGPRQILSNKPISNIDDLKGLKLRAPGAPIYVNSITALGAQAISMPLGDVYTSLQTGAVDSMEGTIDLISQQKFFEQAKFVVVDSHVFQPLFITYNLAAWNKLNKDTQALILKAVKEASAYQRKLHAENLGKETENIKKAGLKFIEITDREKWIEAVTQVSKDYADRYGDLGRKIHETVVSFRKK
ncbi:TRAP transporter substrate-binding protein [Shumkonia mesophila]|uniref:TRAP transporter substrate-binding protein n=1 Tax=Shumkonia mesophila TaxID=2838854 RepID=UPI00293442BE|nr:TRAP transporter substrate-binding protein [Shumkonia mesophila]